MAAIKFQMNHLYIKQNCHKPLQIINHGIESQEKICRYQVTQQYFLCTIVYYRLKKSTINCSICAVEVYHMHIWCAALCAPADTLTSNWVQIFFFEEKKTVKWGCLAVYYGHSLLDFASQRPPRRSGGGALPTPRTSLTWKV